MTDDVLLGEITCPSGELVLMDGGYLSLWSGSRPPTEHDVEGIPPSVNLEIVGPDAEAAAHGLAGFTAEFDQHCAADDPGFLLCGVPVIVGGMPTDRSLPVDTAMRRAATFQGWRTGPEGRMFAVDFRPHSHRYRVMAKVRAAPHEAGTIHVGGAEIMFAMTFVGDGYFPVHVESGAVLAVQVSVTTE
jgi:hypothetical protein